MTDEIKTGVTEETENEEPVLYDDDNDPDWDAVKWGKDEDSDEDEETEDAGEEDIDDKSAEDADHSDKETPAETKDGPAEEPADAAAAADTDQYLELKHFGETKKVGKEEAKVLAQKGMDYDNVRGERDSARSERDALKTENAKLKELEVFLNEVRGDQFASIDDFMMDTRARMRSEANGTKFEDELAALKSKQTPAEAQKPAGEKPSPVDEFLHRFPNVKAEEIPESVWEEVRQTGDLVGAYVKHMESQKADEIQKLKDEIETLKQNQKNKERSAGSSRSSGNKSGKSTIAELWDNGE